MPIFEYRCEKCHHKFEEIVHGDRDKKIPCPKCGSSTEKLMSVIGGIAMGSSGGSPCQASCPGASGACSAAGGGCCPH